MMFGRVENAGGRAATKIRWAIFRAVQNAGWPVSAEVQDW